jgi:hypothetical protein
MVEANNVVMAEILGETRRADGQLMRTATCEVSRCGKAT